MGGARRRGFSWGDFWVASGGWDSVFELGLVGGDFRTGRGLLEVVVEGLLCSSVECPPVGRRNVRIRFRAAGGKIMELDPVLVFRKRFFHPSCVMGSRMIDEEGEFPFPVVARAEDRAGEALGGRSDDRGVAPLGAKLRRTWASGFAAVSFAPPISASSAFARASRLGQLSRIQRCTSAGRCS